MPASSSCRDVDVMILGAGPAGSALALALKQAGVSDVVLVDRPARRPFRIGESAAPSLGSLLLRLGLNDRLEGLGHRPCHGNLFLWGGPAPAIEEFLTRANGPGWHLDRDAFDAWLRAEAVTAGAELLSPAHFTAVRRDADAWQVDIRIGGIDLAARSRWIVDATGRTAALARRSGARLHRFDRLIALAMHAKLAEDWGFDGFSVIEAAEIGWWYAARLPNDTAIVALMTDADLARGANLRSPVVFGQALAATLGIKRFVPLTRCAMQPVVFAAGTQFIDCAIAPGWLALGDALIALDPLSAAGITGAFEDAIAAADTIVRLLGLPGRGEARDLRSAYSARANATLRRYLSERIAIYGREKRWGKSSFWQRRAAVVRQEESDGCGSFA